MIQAGELFGQRREWFRRPGEVGIRRMNGVMGIWSMTGLWLVRMRVSISGRDWWWTGCGSVHMLEMLVVDRNMGVIRLVPAIRVRSSACAVGGSRRHSRGVAIQAVVWWRLAVLLSVPIVIRVRIIIT